MNCIIDSKSNIQGHLLLTASNLLIFLLIALTGCRGEGVSPQTAKTAPVIQKGATAAPTPGSSQLPQEKEWITRLEFSPNGKLLISGGLGEGIAPGSPLRVWDVASGQLMRDLSSQLSSTTAFAFMPDEETFVAADGKRLFIGECATGKVRRILKENLSSHISTLTIAPNGQELMCLSLAYTEMGRDTVLTFWELPSGKFKRSIKLRNFEGKYLSVSRQGTMLAVVGENGYGSGYEIRLWDIVNSKWLKTLKGDGKYCYAIAFSPKKDILAGAVIKSSEMFATTGVHLWDVPSGKLLRVLPQEGGALSLSFSSSGDTLVSSGSALGFGTVRFWNPGDGKCRLILTGTTDHLFATALSPDGKILAASSLMNIVVGDITKMPPGSKSQPYVMGEGAGRLMLWDVDNRKLLREWFLTAKPQG